MEKSNLFTKQKPTEPKKSDSRNKVTINQSNKTFTIIEEQGKYGLVDKSGNLICKPNWDSIDLLEDDKAIIKKDFKYGLINSKGEVLLDTEWDNIYLTLRIKTDILIIEKNNQWGLADINGNIIHQPKWDFICEFKNNFGIQENNKIGLLSLDGTVIVLPQWDNIWYSDIYHNLIAVTKGLGTYLLSDNGTIIRQLTDEEIKAEDDFHRHQRFLTTHGGIENMVCLYPIVQAGEL